VPTAVAFFNNKGGVGRRRLPATLRPPWQARGNDSSSWISIRSATARSWCSTTINGSISMTTLGLRYEDGHCRALREIRAGDSGVVTEDLPVVTASGSSATSCQATPHFQSWRIPGRFLGRFRGGNPGRSVAELPGFAYWRESLRDRYDVVVVDRQSESWGDQQGARSSAATTSSLPCPPTFSASTPSTTSLRGSKWLGEYATGYGGVQRRARWRLATGVFFQKNTRPTGFIATPSSSTVSRSSGAISGGFRPMSRHRDETSGARERSSSSLGSTRA